ncbi:MAG TPA: thiamine phosphate synthase [Nitrospirota bacterium]|nr:thiamine phosphate synthase [Nitrospirota bacterium]
MPCFYDFPCLSASTREVFLPIDFKLYLITDRKQTTVPLPEAIRLALLGGVRGIQLREKDLSIRELLALSQELRSLTKEFGAKLFINDHVDVAVAVEADGVHLGHQSMPASAVRHIIGKKMMIGVSTHNVEEARAAESEGADFITFGPIYETPTKIKINAPVGLEALKSVKKVINIPIFALGGIKGKNIGNVLWAGAYGVSMISAIFGAKDIQKAAKNITEIVKIVDRSICVQCGRR